MNLITINQIINNFILNLMGNEIISCVCINNNGRESIIVDKNIIDRIKSIKEEKASINLELKEKLNNKIEEKYKEETIRKEKIKTEEKTKELTLKNIKEIVENKEIKIKKENNEISTKSSDKVNTDISNKNSLIDNKIIKPKNYKTIIIYGENETGKTSFVLKVCNNKFDVFYIPSFSDEKTNKNLILNSKNYNIEFIVSNDTSMIKECDLFLIFYDLTSLSSYNKAKNLIIEKIYKMNHPIFLIGNKSDLRNQINIPDLKEFTQQYCFEEFKISIKESIGIPSLLKKIGEIFNYDKE